MSKDIPGFSWTASASETIPAYRAVMLTSTAGQVSLTTGATVHVVGIAQNATTVGQAVTIVSSGISLMEAAANTLVPGDKVTTDNAGKAVDGSTAGDAKVGICLETGGAAGDYVAVLLSSPGSINAIT